MTPADELALPTAPRVPPDQLLAPAAPTNWTLFVGFTRIALNGFGGVLPFAFRGLVEQRQWITAAEFAELLAASQVIPGPTICNMSLMVGWRFGGLRGALSALGGMLVGPFVVVVLLGILYQHVGDLAPVRAALTGMSAVATGLIASTAIKMALPVLRRSNGRTLNILLALLAFAGLGLWKLPMIMVIAVLAPVGILLAYRSDR
jgi:chromate transporter